MFLGLSLVRVVPYRGEGGGVVILTQFKLDIESKIWMDLLCTKLQISSTLELLLFWC